MKEIEQYEIDLLEKPHSISNINDLSVESILSLAKQLNISEENSIYCKILLIWNIGYLTLNRIMGTLSGGELTRLYLAEFMAVSENAVLLLMRFQLDLIMKHYYKF